LILVVGLTAHCGTHSGDETSDAAVSCGLAVECPAAFPAGFELSCPHTDLVSVSLTGPCAGDAGAAGYSYSGGGLFLNVESAAPGVCNVALTFGTGFTYSADVTFIAIQPSSVVDPCAIPCRPGLPMPTQSTFMVDNPSTTCVDAEADAEAADVGIDGPTDAASEAAGQAGLDAGMDE
jgi:hypothetical protein